MLLAAILPASARLGETENQLVVRYGQETGKADAEDPDAPIAIRILTFHKSGFRIMVTLFHDVSAKENVGRDNDFDVWPERLIKSMLAVYSQGQTWRIMSNGGWQRDDGTTASYKFPRGFQVKSRGLIDAEEASKRRPQPSENPEGF